MWYVILIIEAYDNKFLSIEFVITYAGLQLYLKGSFYFLISKGEYISLHGDFIRLNPKRKKLPESQPWHRDLFPNGVWSHLAGAWYFQYHLIN